jgi:hypothetical protein
MLANLDQCLTALSGMSRDCMAITWASVRDATDAWRLTNQAHSRNRRSIGAKPFSFPEGCHDHPRSMGCVS